MQTAGYQLPGSGFTASAKPTETNKSNRVYVQGSKVDLLEYYKTLESCNYEQILIKSGSSKKARSYVNLGDDYYYSGQHMWETTYMESYEEEPRLMAVQSEAGKAAIEQGVTAQDGNDETDMEEVAFRYRVIQAVVGKKRLDDLEEQIRSKVIPRPIPAAVCNANETWDVAYNGSDVDVLSQVVKLSFALHQQACSAEILLRSLIGGANFVRNTGAVQDGRRGR